MIAPAKLFVDVSLPQLKELCAAIDRRDQEIGHCCAKLADYKLFAALPGAGPALALLTSPNAAVTSAGCIGATRAQRSCGKPFVEWVPQTITRSFWAKAFYEAYRERGGTFQAAMRALAFKWIRILYRYLLATTRRDPDWKS